MSYEIPETEIGMVECCSDCGNENWYRSNKMVWKVCNECGKVHKPCSLCDYLRHPCSKCPLGADREVVVMESNTNGGMIDFGLDFGLSEYIRGAERVAKDNKLEVPSDDDLVYGWLRDCCGLDDERGYAIIGNGDCKYRVYKGCDDPEFTVDYHGTPMVIDLHDTVVKTSFVVFRD